MEFNKCSKGGALNNPKPPATILLAEDDEDDIFLLREALQDTNMPFVLNTVSNGEDLLREVDRLLPALPDYILLDINMPIKNGYETLNELRTMLHVETPIFMLSTAGDNESVQQAMRLGATGYITKCLSFYQFTALLRSVLITRVTCRV
jgi:DNA-binding response OmpR family regulator